MKGKVIVMANLKPRPLGGFVSNGMVVCSSDKDNTTFELLVPDGPLGERLYLEGMEELFPAGNAVLPVIKKSKTLEKVLEHFKTDGEGYVNWKGYKVRTRAGYIKSNLLNGNVS
jgi:tRNA-binding EMAP/Myf-like protein